MLGPTTTKYEKAADEQQFTMEKFKTNAKRLKDVKESVSQFSLKVSAVLSWEDPFKSTYALITYILMVLYMELWALPILPIEDWNIADRVKMVAKNACWMQE